MLIAWWLHAQVLTVLASVALLGDVLTPFKAGGLLLCTIGIGLYNAIKAQDDATAKGGPPTHARD